MFFENNGRPKTLWQHMIERKEASAYLAQRMSLLVGLDPVTKTIISLTRKVLNSGHYLISGGTGAGKSLTAMLSLCIQLIRGYRDDSGKWSKKAPIIYLDLKGDDALFHAIKHASEYDGRSFRYLSTKPRSGYYFFDPFQCLSPNEIPLIDFATSWLRALEMDYGLGYGKKYFTDQNIVLLTEALEDMYLRWETPSLGVLSSILGDLARQPGKKDAGHIKSAIDILARFPQLNDELHADRPYPTLDFTTSIAAGDVTYVTLPCNQSGSPLRQFAGIILATILQAVQGLRSRGQVIGPVYVFVDEFYHIAGSAFGDLLSTAREWDIHFILANQDIAQTKRHDSELPSIIRTNTSIKQMFSAENVDDRRYLQEASGESLEFKSSFTFSNRSESVTYSENKDWFLDYESLWSVNDSSTMSFLIVNDGISRAPGQRVRPVKSLYPMALIDYERLHVTPPPTTPAYTLKSQIRKANSDASKAGITAQDKFEFSKEDRALQDRLAAKFAELSAAESATLGA